MAKKKNFEIKKTPDISAPAITDKSLIAPPQRPVLPPKITNVTFPAEGNETTTRNFDFTPYYGRSCDEVVFYTQRAIELLRDESIRSNGQSLSMTTVANYADKGLRNFLPVCTLWAQALGREMLLSDMDRTVINHYIVALAAGAHSETYQKSIYSKTKAVLVFMVKRRWLPSITFPKNPYPNINRKSKGQRPISKPERQRLIRGLRQAYRQIVAGTDPLTAYDLSVCVLIIALRTGLNPTPILKLPTDCVQPHPIKVNRRLLVAYKKRGNATRIQSLRYSGDIETLKSIQMDVLDIINLVVERNADLSKRSAHVDRLFVFQSQSNANAGELLVLSKPNLDLNTKAFIDRLDIRDDDGRLLALNVSRLRKTFINSMFELSGQDPLMTAQMGGHSPKVSNDHYLEPPPEAEAAFRFMGEVRNQELLEVGRSIPIKAIENTPISKCRDTKNGHLAPKNGSYCSNFMGCVRCKSFVVTAEDLYRLFSFYWCLVRERSTMSPKKWSRYYGHVIRIIDNEIATEFDKAVVSEARATAKVSPHPFWREPDNLEALPA